MEELVVKLDSPIEAACKGEMVKFKDLVIKCPKTSDYKYYYPIRDIAMKVIMDFQTNKKPEVIDDTKKDDSGSSDEIGDAALFINALMIDAKVDYAALVSKFKNLLLNTDCALFSNKVKITELLFNSLKLSDVEKALGAYIYFFTLPS